LEEEEWGGRGFIIDAPHGGQEILDMFLGLFPSIDTRKRRKEKEEEEEEEVVVDE